jgi:hypothetical protein
MFESMSKIKEHESDFNCKGEVDIFSGKSPKSWKDPETGLIWELKTKENFDKQYTYKEALQHMDNLNRYFYDSSFKWRIPTIDELMTLGSAKLFDYRKKHLSYHTRLSWRKKMEDSRNGRVFAKKPISGFMNHQVDSWYWSSTKSEDFENLDRNQNTLAVKRDNEKMWVVNFFEGGNFHNGIDQKNSVICVRDR